MRSRLLGIPSRRRGKASRRFQWLGRSPRGRLSSTKPRSTPTSTGPRPYECGMEFSSLPVEARRFR
eukprot:45305-Prorocentrum_minimum.AAC.1